ncbi:hypothetical protein GCM10010149_32250 [Nonomuraea roseoviolacea subsp. roseoviolacea]
MGRISLVTIAKMPRVIEATASQAVTGGRVRGWSVVDMDFRSRAWLGCSAKQWRRDGHRRLSDLTSRVAITERTFPL